MQLKNVCVNAETDKSHQLDISAKLLASYDYKNRVTSALSNFLPAYEGRRSDRQTESFTSDDYYGFLDDGEGFSIHD